MSQMKKIPMRKCVGCQEMKGKKEMIRILKTEQEGIILDATGRKNGRGAYICRSGECLEKAIKNRGVERSLKMSIPQEVYDSLKKEIEKIESE
ncbi:MAG: YlxR family protein [Firmicutes bacterium]|nr:YlxR family protein [Lachnospiraceae bacterium]MDD6066722.1 YlxR family protein [Bacillota bacterium]MDY2818622.1 YlxR family protein [Hominisplanchenecus sp.]